MRCAVACLPAPTSASTSTGTSLCASSLITASTGRMLALTPSTNASIPGSDDDPLPPPFPALGNNLPIFTFSIECSSCARHQNSSDCPQHGDCHRSDVVPQE